MTSKHAKIRVCATALTSNMKTCAALPIRILTHNIRYATSDPCEGEKPWPIRKQLILDELRYNTLHNPESFICLQEALHEQLVSLLAGLNSTDEWSYIGVGRDDGKQDGEYSPILFRKKIWTVERWKTVWLSETPEKPGKGWDAGCVRIATVGIFKHIKSRKSVVGVCTHLDNAGEISRHESAKLILEVIGKTTSAVECLSLQRLPVFLAGDFNSEPSDKAYQLLNASDSTIQDSEQLATWRYGNKNTYTGFGDESSRIDFIFLGPRGGGDWETRGYSVLANLFDEVYSSDHRAVVVDAVLAL
jgi:endonuclease/exonuclease/phosphatase family metal-dependent hydrolase